MIMNNRPTWAVIYLFIYLFIYLGHYQNMFLT